MRARAYTDSTDSLSSNGSLVASGRGLRSRPDHVADHAVLAVLAVQRPPEHASCHRYVTFASRSPLHVGFDEQPCREWSRVAVVWRRVAMAMPGREGDASREK